MKLLFLLLSSVSLACSGFAQNVQVGSRVGISKWLSLETAKTQLIPDDIKYSRDKGLFVRYESKRRFALDASLNVYRNKIENIGYAVSSHASYFYHQKDFLTFLEIALSVQYRLTGSSAKIKQYIGITPIVSTGKTTGKMTFTYSDGSVKEYNYKSTTDFTPMLGLDYYVAYPITPHLTISAKIAAIVDLDIASGFRPASYWPTNDSKLSVQPGISYKF